MKDIFLVNYSVKGIKNVIAAKKDMTLYGSAKISNEYI